MKSSRFWLCLATAIIVQALLPTRPALADTYQIFNLGSDEARYIYALGSSGEVVIGYNTTSNTCQLGDTNCFTTWVNGVGTTSNTPPAIASDEGTPCTPSTPSGMQVFQAVCNNGREIMSAAFSGDSHPAIYTGSDPSDYLAGFAGTLLYLNSEGDMVWNNPNSEFWFEAIDQTSQVPEPGSLSLLGIGIITAAGSIRRRLQS